jgi:hypothetical protein
VEFFTVTLGLVLAVRGQPQDQTSQLHRQRIEGLGRLYKLGDTRAVMIEGPSHVTRWARAARNSRTGIETSPKVRCPFQTVTGIYVRA